MAYVFFKRRPKVSTVKPVAVTITGTGNSTSCYATINGTKYSSAASGIEVFAGEIVTFRITGSIAEAELKIDGETATTSKGSANYDWTVPDRISAIEIKLYYSSTMGFPDSSITVTTS